MSDDQRLARIGELAVRAALAGIFLAAAFLKLSSSAFEVRSFAHFGYPMWFMYAVGVAQLVGAALLWVRGYTGHGAALLAILMVGAVISHLAAGDTVVLAIPAAILCVIAARLAHAQRADLVATLGRMVPPAQPSAAPRPR